MKKKDTRTEQLILDAARRVFQRSGYGGARMQEIADEAKISKASLHYYFRSKDKLFHTVFREDIRLFLGPLVGILRDPSLTLDVRIRTFVGSYIKTMLDNPGLPLFIMQELSSNPGRLISLVEQTVPGKEAGVDDHPLLAVFIRQIEDGMEAGTCRMVDPEQFILSMISMCIFPFIGRPLIMLLLKKDEKQYRDFLVRREEEILEYLYRILYTDDQPKENPQS
jgi:TetR/AcrR family transcriptional regulator